MQDLLTLKEIARQLDVPESNLRYYKNRIGEFLPSVGKGRRRRYLPESMEIFQRTIALVQEGMTLDRVYKHLAQEQPPEIESLGGTTRDEYAARIAEKVVEALSSGAAQAGQGGGEGVNIILEDLRNEISSSRGRIEGLESENRRLEIALAEATGGRDSLEKELHTLKEQVAQKQRELEEKERIIDLQRTQLLDARDKRMNIVEELQQIKSLLGSSTDTQGSI